MAAFTASRNWLWASGDVVSRCVKQGVHLADGINQRFFIGAEKFLGEGGALPVSILPALFVGNGGSEVEHGVRGKQLKGAKAWVAAGDE